MWKFVIGSPPTTDRGIKMRKIIDKERNIKKIVVTVLAVLLVLCIIMLIGAGRLFEEELAIIGTIEKLKISDEKSFYYMEVKGDYHFEEFLNAGGASSDYEVSVFLTNKISKGFYSVEVDNIGLGCSAISAETLTGTHIWGRNYDWTGSVPIIVRCVPKEGYASISTCDFQNITGNAETLPEGMVNQMLAIAALYVPLDGINEAGLCVADLEVNEGGMITVDTEKPDLTITTAIRLILNKAATVEEAVVLLKQYDIHASGGISHHLSISDATGAAVSVEFVNGEIVVIDTNFVTNFNLANGDTSAGGESAQSRYESLKAVYQNHAGILTNQQVKEALLQVSQSTGTWTTQWSIVYEQDALRADYYFEGNYEKGYSYSVVE